MCDEPISALDVSVRAQIVNLLTALRDKHNLTYLFIAHDLSVVKYISDRIAVMYLGVIVESAAPEVLFAHPAHPYTKALLSAIPLPDPDLSRSRARIRLTGDVPSPLNVGAGCRFASRCSEAAAHRCAERCRTEQPAMTEVEAGHTAACHLL
jgi:oligopeptide/dipeptide ABC transporter ATP-binding protein